MRNTTEIKVRLLLLRHGLVEGNEEHRYIGCRTDAALSDKGRASLLTTRELIPESGLEPELIFSSPLIRCRESAFLLFGEELESQEAREEFEFALEMIPEFKEIDFGRFEGENYESLKEDPDYQAWIESRGTIAFPEGESRESFIERNKKGFQKILKSIRLDVDASILSDLISEDDGEICMDAAAIVHGGTIMAIMSAFTDLDYFDAQVPNGAGYILEFVLKRGEISDLSYRRFPDGISS